MGGASAPGDIGSAIESHGILGTETEEIGKYYNRGGRRAVSRERRTMWKYKINC